MLVVRMTAMWQTKLKTEDVAIFQTFHKPFIHNNNCKWIKPVGVGGYVPYNGFIDCVGDNIAELNKFYCELTVQYWAWKNYNSDVYGFFHYRRYLNFRGHQKGVSSGAVSQDVFRKIMFDITADDSLERIKMLLHVYDVIVPERTYVYPNIVAQFCMYNEKEIFLEYIDLLKHFYSCRCDPSFFYENLNFFNATNLFIMKKNVFFKYCNDLFFIIDKLYYKYGSPYGEYANRWPGFIGERFLSFFIYQHKLDAVEVPHILVL